MFTVNGRFQLQNLTGAQRYAAEICARLTTAHSLVCPKWRLSGKSGHIWEQAVLPRLSGNTLLWSPCNTGPVLVRKHVITIHDIASLEHPEWFSRAFSGLYRVLIPELVKRALQIITVSNHAKSRIVQVLRVDEKKVTVVPNGVGANFKRKTELEVSSVRQKLVIPEGPYILSVCSLEPRKNVARLLEAWNSIKEESGNATLVIAGPQGKSSIFRAAKESRTLERTLFTGRVPEQDLPALYTGATAYVYPSLYEGFGLPPLEAASCGTAVITSRHTAMEETAGPSTVLVDPTSTSDLADAIKSALQSTPDPVAGLRAEAHAQSFTWDRSAAQTEKILLSYC